MLFQISDEHDFLWTKTVQIQTQVFQNAYRVDRYKNTKERIESKTKTKASLPLFRKLNNSIHTLYYGKKTFLG